MRSVHLQAGVALAALILLGSGAQAGLPEEVYTLRELLERSELIAIGRAVPSDGESRGKELLKEGLLELREILKGTVEPGRVRFRVAGPPLPAGAKAVWFLARPGADGVYVVDHPQCAYDVTHRTLIEIAIRKPDRIRPGYYLRREDERLAEAVRKAKEISGIRGLAPGPSANGLELTIAAARRSTRAGNVLVVEFALANRSTSPLVVCDSAEECYYARMVRLVPPPEPTGPTDEIARAGADPLEMEHALGLGQLVSAQDFVTLEPGAGTTRTLSLSERSFSLLRAAGTVRVWGVYRYQEPDQPLVKLPANPWTGAVVSRPIEVVLLPPLTVGP